MPSDVAGARSRRPSPRERLLKAADELFYAEGVNSVGIDRVIERADVARASLYSTFGSKDELIRAYLENRMEISKARLRAAVEAHADPRERVLSVFGVQAAVFARPGYHGCPFSRATAEAQPGSAAYEVPRAYRGWVRDFLRELAAEAGVPDPGLLASQIHLLYDGAMQAASLDGNAGITAASRAAAEALLDAALASRGSGRHRRQDEPVQVGTFASSRTDLLLPSRSRFAVVTGEDAGPSGGNRSRLSLPDSAEPHRRAGSRRPTSPRRTGCR